MHNVDVAGAPCAFALRSETASRVLGWLRYFWNYANRPCSNDSLSAVTDTAYRNLYVRNYESTICCHPHVRLVPVESIIAFRYRLAIKQLTITFLLIYSRDIHVKIYRANIFSSLRLSRSSNIYLSPYLYYFLCLILQIYQFIIWI